jgi:uncharacterized SAM-binding protein YcdF (DUF218 family)
MLSRVLKTKKQIIWRLTTVAIIAIALWALIAWAAAELLIVHASFAKADAIVVMSGSATFRERAQHAAALYNQGRAPKIVLTNDHLKSSWSSEEQRNPYYYERALDELRRSGVPQQSIAVIMVPITSTYDEAMLLKEYAEVNQLHSLLIVTSGYHSRRAFWTFRRIFQGSETSIGIDPAEPGIQTPSPATWWLHRAGWAMVPTEYVKMIGYRARI